MNELATTRSDAEVKAALASALEKNQINQEQAADIFWLHGHAVERKMSNDDVARFIGKSKATVSQIFGGNYGAADWSSICSAIAQVRRRESKRLRGVDVGFVESETAKIIFKTCDNALLDGMPAFIYGASQLGKTRALEEYVRRANSSAVKYFRCRSGMTHLSFAKFFAESCHMKGINTKSSTELIDGVCKSLDKDCLVIIDEFHLCLETVRQDASKRLVEFIREIYDLSHCGLVLSSTKVGLADLEEGPNRLLFDQLRRRGTIKVVLPDVPPLKDINTFARAYGFAIPSGDVLKFIKSLLQTRGLGVFCAYMNKTVARLKQYNESHDQARSLDWDFFLDTARGFESLATIKADY